MSLHGKVVEYIEHGKFICGFVIEDAGTRLKLLNQNGREVSLPPARVLHSSTKSLPLNLPREELLHQLRATADRRQALENTDLQTIWELACEEADSTFDPHFLTELLHGKEADDDRVASFLRSVFLNRIFFKYREGKIVVHPPEVVAQLLLQQEKERQKELLLLNSAAGIARLKQDGKTEDWPEKDACLALLARHYLFDNEAEDSDMARELVKRAGLSGPHDIFHLLVQAGVWAPDENIYLKRFEIPTEFDEAQLALAAKIKEPDADTLLAEGRRDLRHLKLFTIDSETTKDFDDALHLEKRDDNYLVGVHITDVSRFVRPQDLLFLEAEKRTTSLYFADRHIPMLPPVLSESICSLIAGKPRPAISFLILLSNAGEVLKFELVASVVQVSRRLSYNEVEKKLARGEDEELQILSDLSEKLREKRIEAGAVLIPIPDVNISIAPDESIGIELSPVDTKSRSLVAECMVLANTLAASFVADREVTGLFRCQEPPHRRLNRRPVKDLFTNCTQRKQLRPSMLAISPKPHSGVGVMQYTTVTSPIRRLLDLVMQHQISGLLRGDGARFNASELNNFIGLINATQGRVSTVLRLRHRYWLLKYLEKREGERLEAIIIVKNPKRVIVVLPEILMESDLPPSAAIKAGPGDTVRVKIARVRPLDDLLRLEW